MKYKNIYIKIFLPLMVSFLILGIFTESVSNILFLIMDDVYFIPKESNIFVFKATEWNDGSGDWWIYGEDNKYYYMAIDKNHYYKLSKGQEPIKFNKFDYKTWGENILPENTVRPSLKPF